MEESYYKKIIYKKNAFDDLKTYIKLNFKNKHIMLVSTKSVPAEDVTMVLNALFLGSENVTHFVARNNFDKDELCTLAGKLTSKKPDLIVSLGAGRCCDVVKYYCYNFNLPYICCPTSASSLAYFINYCINPYDSTQSFYANAPIKIFIAENIIKNSSLLTNINGLCALESLRSVHLEGKASKREDESYILLGLEKLFDKLSGEQTSILLCNEDSNLVLMDLMIDFGFFINMLKVEDFYLYNMYQILEKISNVKENGFAGKRLLLCAKSILITIKEYIELNTTKVLEKNNFSHIANLLEKHRIKYKTLKNNSFFNEFMQKYYLKREFLENKDEIYKIVNMHIMAINSFSKKVKSVYRYGIEVDDNLDDALVSLSITPYVYNGNTLVNLMTGSGVLNGLFLG